MSFTNLYYKRTAGTPKACFVCSRPTATVLATANSVDFIYTCDGHLSDPGFASPVTPSETEVGVARKPNVSDEEIKKIKEEWEEKQRRKNEKEREDKDGKDKVDVAGKDKESEKNKSIPPTSSTTTSTPSSSPPPKPVRYALHRQMFVMRQAEHRRRRQATQAKEIAPRLPNAPRTAVSIPPGSQSDAPPNSSSSSSSPSTPSTFS